MFVRRGWSLEKARTRLLPNLWLIHAPLHSPSKHALTKAYTWKTLRQEKCKAAWNGFANERPSRRALSVRGRGVEQINRECLATSKAIDMWRRVCGSWEELNEIKISLWWSESWWWREIMQRPIGRENKFTFSPCVEVRSSTNQNLGVRCDSSPCGWPDACRQRANNWSSGRKTQPCDRQV